MLTSRFGQAIKCIGMDLAFNFLSSPLDHKETEKMQHILRRELIVGKLLGALIKVIQIVRYVPMISYGKKVTITKTDCGMSV